MHIIIPDDYQDCVRYLSCFEKLLGHSVQVFHDSPKDLASLASRFALAEALVLTRERTQISATLLEQLPRLRLISQTGRAGSHIDVEACTRHGVAVAETHSTGTATAELTWALVLASRRHLVAEANRLRDGLWQGHLGCKLQGATLGIWGYGRIGKQVAAYGKVFGMRVWIWGSENSRMQAAADGFEAAPSREAFFAESDVLSLHLRLLRATYGLVTRSDLQRMKPSALFVNTSRAELLQPGALERAVRHGRPGFAAVDVYESEPVLGARHPLLHLPNVLCTPHLGFVERDNYESFYGQAFDNILWYLQGRQDHLLNPQAVSHPRQKAALAGFTVGTSPKGYPKLMNHPQG